MGAAKYLRHFYLDGKVPRPIHNIIGWAKWFEMADRHVAQHYLKNGVRISTVFLGLNHNWGEGPPILFETMIFGGWYDQRYCERYSTWEEAETGHGLALRKAMLFVWVPAKLQELIYRLFMS